MPIRLDKFLLPILKSISNFLSDSKLNESADFADPSSSESFLAADYSMMTNAPDVKGQIKIKLKFKDNKFYVNCLQCRHLKAATSITMPPIPQVTSSSSSNSALRPYVKCYLRPDVNKVTKQKAQALFNGANPIFHEVMEYDIGLNDLKNRTLEVNVINNSKLQNKEKIGCVEIRLYDINWDNVYVKWYDLR